jgi:hypothetical protein
MTRITITTIPTIPYGMPSPPRYPPPLSSWLFLLLLRREKGRDGYAPARSVYPHLSTRPQNYDTLKHRLESAHSALEAAAVEARRRVRLNGGR